MTRYSTLAKFIGRHHEYAIYRRFGADNAKRLLFMQAELCWLRRRLQVIADEDAEDLVKVDFEKSWYKLSHACAEDGSSLQYQMTQEFFDKLDKYYGAVLQTQQIMSIPQPRPFLVNFFRYWLEWERGGDNFLQGIEADPYQEDHTDDLVTLSSQTGSDSFAQYLCDTLLPTYHRLIGQLTRPTYDDEEQGKLWQYRPETFVVLGDLVCALLSATIPVTAIFVLYFVRNMLNRLTVVTVLSFFFSFIMATVCRGHRVDVFAATLAFAAVQVVFVGNVNAVE